MSDLFTYLERQGWTRHEGNIMESPSRRLYCFDAHLLALADLLYSRGYQDGVASLQRPQFE